MDRRAFLKNSAALTGGAALGATTLFEQPAMASAAASHIRDVTAYTQVYGDGQKLSHLVVRYDDAIDGGRLSPAAFTVADRTVKSVWTTDRPGIDAHSRTKSGRFVVLELSLDDAAALLWVQLPNTGGGPGAGGPVVGDTTPGHKVVPASASVLQAEAVYTAHGAVYAPASEAVTNSATRNLIVDEFQQFTYADAATGLSLPYNLFVPRGYDKHKKYPLVLFMHDAGVINAGPIAPLVQGVGATVWTQYECFVVAPAYPAIVVDDYYQPSGYFDATVNLVNSLTGRYRIDKHQLHTTGQSMGAMMSLGMNIRHPSLFATSYIVAGQWPADQADPLAHKKMWVCVSQGDTKAYPGISAIVDEIEPLGASVTTATWSGAATQAEFRADVAAMESAHANFNFASFTAGTLPGTGGGGNGGSEHTSTWQVAYDIPGVREWVLKA